MIRYDSEGPGTPAAAGRSMEPAGASGCPATHPHDTPSQTGRTGRWGKAWGDDRAPPAPRGRRPAERGTMSPCGMPIDSPRTPASGGKDNSSGDPPPHAPHCTLQEGRCHHPTATQPDAAERWARLPVRQPQRRRPGGTRLQHTRHCLHTFNTTKQGWQTRGTVPVGVWL